jgi:hypothetical protein
MGVDLVIQHARIVSRKGYPTVVLLIVNCILL